MSKSGRTAKRKGSVFERQVRDEIRSIYPSERRDLIQRVPLSGAGIYKGDIVDMNNTEWCYEAKKQEIVKLHDWWRQTKREAKAWQIPCLIFSSNRRGIYWAMHEADARALLEGMYGSALDILLHPVDGTTRNIYDKLESMYSHQYYRLKLDNDPVVVMTTEMFIGSRKYIQRIKEGANGQEEGSR